MTKSEEFQCSDKFIHNKINEWKYIRLEIMSTLKNIKKVKNMFQTYDNIQFNENYEQIDDIYVDYHGAAMQAVQDQGRVKKEIKQFDQLIEIIGDGKIDLTIIPSNF